MKSIILLKYLEFFKAAVAEAATVELKMRLLAEKTMGLELISQNDQLALIEAALIKHYKLLLCDDDETTLLKCRQIRNKLLHGDFFKARQKMSEFNETQNRAEVVKVNLISTNFENVSRQLEEAKIGMQGTRIKDTNSTKSGGTFGWFIEAGNSGDFEKAINYFRKAGELIDRLAEID